MLPVELAVLFHFQALGVFLLILNGSIVSILADITLEYYVISHLLIPASMKLILICP